MTSIVPILWWNQRHSYVKCPFCSEIHGLSTPPRGLIECSRGSIGRSRIHLLLDPRFQFQYRLPLSDYEIDKENFRFVALGADPPPPEPSPLASTTQSLERLSVFDTHPIWSRHIDDEARAEVIIGNRRLVALFLLESSEVEVFLNGCDQGGSTALGLAAIEGHYDIVELLLDFGAPINILDYKQRTPLMWASLLGHYSVTQLLVDRGANRGLRDIDGFTAIDLASPSERNEIERNYTPAYKGWTEEASTARKIIVNYLLADAKVLQQALPPCIKETTNWSFERISSLKFKLSQTSETQIHLDNFHQAVGILSRGGNYPPMATKSGWRDGALKANLEEIMPTGRFWRNEAMRIAKDVDFSFLSDRRDETRSGQFHASHVEPKLIAFFISKHVFLRSELQANKGLRDLQQATPQNGMLTRATILVNKPPC
ncbi:hypothetical protein BC567DRAFT_281004 [Phyllosticta citribraziliensis]